jgi:type IV secretory pathway TraG/TraD family ATPase VirD4
MGEVVIDDAYNTFPEYLEQFHHGGYNALAHLNPDDDSFMSRAMGIAAACVPQNPNSKDRFWDDSARTLIQVLIMCEVILNPTASLASVAEILSGDVDAYLRNALGIESRREKKRA